MTTFMSNPTDLDLHLEPLFDGVGDRQEPAPTTVANPRRTTWTGYAKDAGDRLPSV
ncbi:hypothetical protein [Nocardioides aquiterrae]